MTETFFFYDLETSGFNPRDQRIMQFAGQRTSLDMQPIGDPFNILIAVTDDVLPDPDAIIVTGITPQKTKAEGITEAEFLQIFHKSVATPGTIFVGYNSIRFDDEFIRYLHYRNFYDPYEWHWQDKRGRWDLLDVVRMTRALRPDGITWPFASDGKPANTLELLASVNKLTHISAHDALSDVGATIELAKLISKKQPKLFSYLLSMRQKNMVEKLVKAGEPFVYSSGKYPHETQKTTVVQYVADNPKSGALVYDLRYDPKDWINKTPIQLVEAWKWKKDNTEPRLPVKTLQYNRCPAVAPLSVLDESSIKRLDIDMKLAHKNMKTLRDNPKFSDNLLKALTILNKQQQTTFMANEQLVDAQLYDNFLNNQDKPAMSAVRSATAEELLTLTPHFKDPRLSSLLPLYKARNFPGALSIDDREIWESFRQQKLLSGDQSSRAAKFFMRIAELDKEPGLNSEKRYILEELQLYGESILPEPN